MDLGLEGKVALVTGGSDGIGKAAAISMAAEGARLAICARRPDVLEMAADEIRRATGGEVMAVPADVTRPDQIADLFDKVVAAYGRIDILVNNAGTSSSGYFGDMADHDWQADLDLKLFAAIRCSRLAIPYMKAQGGGRIINITSVGGKAPGAGSTPSSVSRAAGIALTKAMSRDYAPDNILVNTVCLGILRSGQYHPSEELGLTLDQVYSQFAKEIPLGRVGEAKEAGDLIAFLASGRASFITGAAINVDGGESSVV